MGRHFGTTATLVAIAASLLLYAASSATLGSAGAGPMDLGSLWPPSSQQEVVGGDALLRRALAARKPTTNGYTSYAALRKDQVPCNQRGRSYYYSNCASPQAANPYRRGCSVITRCAGDTN